jgi:hypothetical protein
MILPTEPIGSIPRPAALLEGIRAFGDGRRLQQELDALYDSATRDTILRFEATGSPVISGVLGAEFVKDPDHPNTPAALAWQRGGCQKMQIQGKPSNSGQAPS